MQRQALLKVPSLLCSLWSLGLAFWLAWLEGVGGQWFQSVNRRGYPTGQGDPSCDVARTTCCQVLPLGGACSYGRACLAAFCCWATSVWLWLVH